jgi:O-antigen/teichoic acid export membrane protein
MALYRKTYTVIGIAVAVLGISVTPFISIIIGNMPDIPHITLIYILFVINSASSYFFVYKKSIIVADQIKYIESSVSVIFSVIINITQILFMILTHNYIVYLLIMIFFTVMQNAVYSVKSRQLYPFLTSKNVMPLEKSEIKQIKKNVGAMMFHKIGAVLVNGTDNLLIAKFVSVISVGLYSNYLLIKIAITNALTIVFSSATASIGNLNAEDNDESKNSVFKKVNFVCAWLFGFCSICLFCLYNPFIRIWLGDQYLFTTEIVFIIILNFYVSGMRQSVLTMREAMGLFWNDRYKPLFESTIHFAVSITLAVDYGITGIFVGTLVSTLTTCFWIEPYVLYKYGLHSKLIYYFKDYAIYMALTAITGTGTYILCYLAGDGGLWVFVCKCIICAVFPNAVFALCYCRRDEFRFIVSLFSDMISKRIGGIYRIAENHKQNLYK